MLKKILSTLFKIALLLLWTIVFYLQFERPYIARFAQNVSPSLLISSITQNVFWIIWISLPLVLLAFLKGRFFCWKICPVGIIQDLIPSLGKPRFTNVNLLIFLALFSASIFSVNLLAVFDPLVSYNRIFTIIKFKSTVLLIFVLPLIVIILLNVYRKRFWCVSLCPLGALIDWIINIKNKKKIDTDKRKTLLAFGAGLTAAAIYRTKSFFGRVVNDRLLRPPGALPEEKFVKQCIRCGSCISVCLTGTLTPSFTEGGMEGIFTPKLTPQIAECDEFCNKCNEACPTFAIKKMTLEEKRNIKIGTADIDRRKCIAWSKNSLCLICQEVCPYLAIEKQKNISGTPCPRVNPKLCRGCGHCENSCPASPIRAIKVYNVDAGQVAANQPAGG